MASRWARRDLTGATSSLRGFDLVAPGFLRVAGDTVKPRILRKMNCFLKGAASLLTRAASRARVAHTGHPRR